MCKEINRLYGMFGGGERYRGGAEGGRRLLDGGASLNKGEDTIQKKK